MSPTSASVTLRLRQELGLPRGETMWADPLRAGRSRLLNSSFFVPLCVGDSVATARQDGRDVVVGLVEPGDMSLSTVAVDPRISEVEVRQAADRWRAQGASWTEGSFGVLNTVWPPTLTADDVFAYLRDDLAERDGWDLPAVYAPEDRTEALIRRIAVLG